MGEKREKITDKFQMDSFVSLVWVQYLHFETERFCLRKPERLKRIKSIKHVKGKLFQIIKTWFKLSVDLINYRDRLSTLKTIQVKNHFFLTNYLYVWLYESKEGK